MLITNATVVTGETPNRVLPGHAVLLSGSHIQEIGPSAQLDRAYPKARKLDAHGQLAMPGGICAHTHFYGTFARGLAIPPPAPRDFPEILEMLWWRLDRALSEEDVRVSALICLVDAIRHGTTTIFDHHASPACVDGCLDVIADAVEQAGVRAVLCYEVSDRDGPGSADAGIKENVRFLKRVASNPSSRLAAMFGLHASLTLSGATLQACRAAWPADGGFHIHVAEHEQDEYDSLQKSNMRVVERLQNHEILGERSIAAHCVHVDAAEIGLLKSTQTWVTHQPRSNMNNAVGAAPVESMLRAGVRVCLGNDGFSNAMWDEWKAAYLLHKAATRDPRRMGGSQVMQMAVANNAALASSFFREAPVGQVVPGAMADLMLVDYHSPTPVTADNFAWHVIFGLQASMVTTTIAAGRVLMKDRKLTTLDEARIAARARELAPRVWRRFEDNSRQ
ncbi:MAG: putative aminohydrolase SsnA [Chloroflexota bacterium]